MRTGSSDTVTRRGPTTARKAPRVANATDLPIQHADALLAAATKMEGMCANFLAVTEGATGRMYAFCEIMQQMEIREAVELCITQAECLERTIRLARAAICQFRFLRRRTLARIAQGHMADPPEEGPDDYDDEALVQKGEEIAQALR